MRTRTWVCTATLLLAVASGANPPPGRAGEMTTRFDAEEWPLGDLYLSYAEVVDSGGYYDPCGPFSSLPGEPFDVYLVADIDYSDIGHEELHGASAISGWEAGLEVPASWTLVEEEFFPGTAVNSSAEPYNYIVDLQQDVVLQGDPRMLARFRFHTSDAAAGEPSAHRKSRFYVGLTAASPSRFDRWERSRPGWVESRGGATHLRGFFATYEAGDLNGFGPLFCGPDACYSYVERPLAGDVWIGNTVETVLFSSTHGVIDGGYTLDGQNWEWLPGVTQQSNTRFVEWTVPNVATDVAQIHICNGCCFLQRIWTDSGVFRIEEEVAVRASSWGALKARFE